MAQVREAMTRGVRSMAPDDSVLLAAQAMSELDVGVIPVCEGERLVGMVTDRDIVLRAVAQDCAPSKTSLSSVMSTQTCWCFEDAEVEEANERMREAQIRRMPVLDHDKRLVGMLSLGDVATKSDMGEAATTLEAVSVPSRPDRSHQSAASGAAGGGQSDAARDQV
jgi:CBS domain-containing protein